MIEERLNSFLNEIDFDHLLQDFSEDERSDSLILIATFKSEAIVGLRMIETLLKRDSRILEVGAGLCMLSLFLKQEGYNIVALEPLAGGFGFFEKLKNKILQQHVNLNLPVLNKTAEKLNKSDDGSFDLIFSNNVIEHIQALDETFVSMRSVLAEQGSMVHGCPNYVVPYEPHFGLPVLSIAPKLTEVIWKKRVDQRRQVWDSLNFVTYFKVKKIARAISCSVQFKTELTYQAFGRLNDDKQFQLRHKKTMIGQVYRILSVTKMLHITKLLPPWLSTPMVFSLTPLITEK